MKVALYKNSRSSMKVVGEIEVFDEFRGYIKLTEDSDVIFIGLDQSELSKKEIAAIDDQITSEMAESESRLNVLKQKRQELLAITDVAE